MNRATRSTICATHSNPAINATMATVDFAAALHTLEQFYGPLPTLLPKAIRGDPFALVLWEQVAYLATDATRAEAFAALTRRVGLTPDAILDAPVATLETVCRIGGPIAFGDRAERMRTSARMVIAKWSGDARTILALPEDQSRRALATFPMIGQPGADKILALTGFGTQLPLDSNALRVVERLGFVEAGRDYRATYRAAQTALSNISRSDAVRRVAVSQLLRHHGRELCRRSAPRCGMCPLANQCPSRQGG